MGSKTPNTELELIMFQNFPLGKLVWHLITQVNGGIIAAYITVFDPRKVKRRRLIPFMVYDLVYPSIASNLLTLYTISPWYDYVCKHTWSPLSINTLLMLYITVVTGLLIK